MMRSEWPHESQPLTFIPWWLDQIVQLRTMIVIAWPDAVARKTSLRTFARRHCAVYLTCRRFTSLKDFLRFIMLGCRIVRPKATTYELFDELQDWLVRHEMLLMLDEAEQLTPRTLHAVRSLHVHTNQSIVLSTGTAELARKIDSVDCDGTFWSRTVSWHHDVPLSKKQQRRRDVIRRI